MSDQRILGKMVCRVVLCWVLLLSLYFIHEMGHLALYNLLSNTNYGRLAFDGRRFLIYHPAGLEPFAAKTVHAGGLMATLPTVILVRKRTPLLGMAALFWIIYGIYETFLLGIPI